MIHNKNQPARKGSPLNYGAETSGCPSECVPDLIRKRAYQLFEERGRQPGHDLADWLQAEREINQRLGR
jgi:hypothetical protein